MPASKGLALAGSWAAVAAAVVATSGMAAPEATPILLACGGIVALVLTTASRRT